MNQIILSQIAALFFGILIGVVFIKFYYSYLLLRSELILGQLRDDIKSLHKALAEKCFENDELINRLEYYTMINARGFRQVVELKNTCEYLYQKWQKATHHIEQLVHSIKEPEVNKMSLGKLLATYHHESQLVESHLSDRFDPVKITETKATYTNGINYLLLTYDVFGYPAMANFSRTGNEGYMMVITYRGVIVYSDKTPDKSYFTQVCENAMLEFITKFDLKFGRK